MSLPRRFVILYFTLYFLPFPLSVLSGLAGWPPPAQWIGSAAGVVEGSYRRGADLLAVWVGETLLRLGPGGVVLQPTGSGDTMAAYVRMLCMLVVALVGSLLWTWRARGAPVTSRVSDNFHVYLRYAVAAVLLGYGFAKLPPSQFQPPGADLLVRTYGDSSPMGLLWTFMGYSPAYTMFAGVAEIVPGLLLLFQRTTTLGALIGAATMTNVVVLNFCYDVPVKLYSLHLLLALLTIAAPDVRRLLDFFVLNRAVATIAPRPPRGRAMTALKIAVALIVVATPAVSGYRGWSTYGPGAPPVPVDGVYEIETFSLNGEPRPALWTDPTRWRSVLIGRRGTAVVIQTMGGRNERFGLQHDTDKGAFVFRVLGGTDTFTFARTELDDGRLRLEGTFRDGVIAAELKRGDVRAFPLMSRPFNWIQELPYNR